MNIIRVSRWARSCLALALLAGCEDSPSARDGALTRDAELPTDASGIVDAGTTPDSTVSPSGDSSLPVWTWDPPRTDAGVPNQLSSPRSNLNVFFTGHSLIDNPLAEDVAALAQEAGQQHRWNQQIILGSPLRIRTRGNDANSSSWQGYRTGKNRGGENLNVIEELRNPSTISGARYDTMVATENHNMLDMLLWENTVRYLRHFHERFIQGNAQGRTYFYTPWLDIEDKSNPDSWLNYEQAALPAWECVATRINRSLEAEGRSDRLTVIPANMALATLIQRATSGNVAGVSGSSKQETINRLLSDNVHLTRMGVYYMALVTYSSIYGRSPIGGYKPAEVDGTAAASLQSVAWDVVTYYYGSEPKRTLSDCVAHMQNTFCDRYASYKGSVDGCKPRFSMQNTDNPMYFGQSSDRAYWFPAP